MNPPSALLLVRDALEEHERREVHHVAPLAAREVQDDGNNDACQPEQEQRDEKRQTHRFRLECSRASRYWKSARSSGFEVSSNV